jgi:hypothetical protein
MITGPVRAHALKFLRPRNLRKAVRVCNNLKIPMVHVQHASQNLARREPMVGLSPGWLGWLALHVTVAAMVAQSVRVRPGVGP